jgi:predicted molibdopterin-dependent oxidoreductase YjgC
MSRLHRYAYRPWSIQSRAHTVCPHCGVGCLMVLETRDEEIQRAIPDKRLGPGGGLLCARGYFGYDFTSSPERLATPMVRKNGTLEPASWEEALDTITERLLQARDKYGGDSIAAIASARCTNEDNYLFQKLMRAGLRTNNIDSILRTGFAGAVRLIEGMLGPESTSNTISEIVDSDAVLVAGGDPTRSSPVLGVQVRRAFRKGAKVITTGYSPGLHMHSSISICPAPGSEGIVLGSLLDGLLKSTSLSGNNLALEDTIRALPLPSADETENSKALAAALEALSGKTSVSIVIDPDISAYPSGTAGIIILGALAYVLGAKVYLTSVRPNDRGLLQMGCLPDTLPGGDPLSTDTSRDRLSKAWGFDIPPKEGLTLMEIIESAHSGAIKALYIMGDNPVMNLPDRAFTIEALEGLDLLVVQDIFMTETAAAADVVLPSMNWAERDGSFTNLEGKTQRLERAVAGNAMEDWKIISAVGKRLGLDMDFGSAEDVFAEIVQILPLYSRLRVSEPGGPATRPGYGHSHGDEMSINTTLESIRNIYRKPSFSRGNEIHLMVGKPLFGTSVMNSNSGALNSVKTSTEAVLGEATAARLSIHSGDNVEVSSDRGAMVLPTRIERGIPENVIILENTNKSTGVLFLFGYNISSHIKAPILEAKNVNVQRVEL